MAAAPPAPGPRRLRPSECPLLGVAEGTWLPEDGDPIEPRNGLLEQFQTLADELRGEVGQPRDIATRPREAGDEPAPNRIASNKDNGDSRSRLLGHTGAECASFGHDDINLERNQFGRKSGEPLELPLGISVFNHDVAALDVTEITQSLTEGLVLVGAGGEVGVQVAYSSDVGRLLPLSAERRECEAE